MIDTLRNYVLLFMIYSFIGWVVEIIINLFNKKKFVNRGFLIGPCLPIYGFGSIGIIIFLSKYSNDFITVFCMGTVLCCVLEYFTSYIMEQLFRARWWDYSNKKFNIAGRICLETAVLFGLGGCIIIYFVNPLLVKLLEIVSPVILNIIVILFIIVFVVDFLVSFKVIFTFRNFANNLKKDSTAEMNKLVNKMITSKSILGKRLMQAFPNFKIDIERLKNIRLAKKRKK